MKILHILDHSLPMQDGYAYRSYEIIKFQRKKLGYETIHITSAKQGRTNADIESAEGLEFYRTQPVEGMPGTLPVLDQWSVVTSLKKRLREIVQQEKPDILHAHSPALNGLAALSVAREFNLPLIYEVRSFWEDAAVDKGACKEGDLRYRLTRAMETYVLKRADHVVVICEGLRQDISARGIPSDKLTVVHNSVDIENFHTEHDKDLHLADELRLAQGKTLGFIGSFYAFEGLEVLIDAMPLILKSLPDLKLLLVGGGVQDELLKEKTKQLGVQENIVFTGRVPHDQVTRYYNLIDVFVYPRVSMRITNFVTPLKPLEAMAQGGLVIASDVGGHREMVRDTINGLLFHAGSAESLAETCVKMFSHEETWAEFRRQGREYVTTDRNWGNTIEKYADVYRLSRTDSNL